MPRSVAVEFDFAEAAAVRTRPAAVIPRPRDEEIDPLLVVRLQRLVNLDRAVKVLLIPPSRDSEHRDVYLLQVSGHRLPSPELVVVGVIDEIVPGWNFAVQVFLVDGRERAQSQEPFVGVVSVKIESDLLLVGFHPRRVLEPVAQPERAVVMKI